MKEVELDIFFIFCEEKIKIRNWVALIFRYQELKSMVFTVFLVEIKQCLFFNSEPVKSLGIKELNVMLYILNVAGLDFIWSNYYEVKIHYQCFVILFVHDCGILFLDILMLNY